MSEKFQKGDRVRVVYEGKVTRTHATGAVDVMTSDGLVYVSSCIVDAVTLVERPVEPLAPGSVVRGDTGDTWVVKRKGITYIPEAGAPFGSIESPESLALLVRDQPGLTLIHDGSNA